MFKRPFFSAQAVQSVQACCQLCTADAETVFATHCMHTSTSVPHLLTCCCLDAAAGIGLISDVIDFSQADDGAMIAYGISDQLDDLKVLSHEAYLVCVL